MRAVDLATASILILLGGVVVADSLRIGIGWGTDGPRSGFFPFWLGVVIGIGETLVAIYFVRRTVDYRGRYKKLGGILLCLSQAQPLLLLVNGFGGQTKTPVADGDKKNPPDPDGKRSPESWRRREGAKHRCRGVLPPFTVGSLTITR